MITVCIVPTAVFIASNWYDVWEHVQTIFDKIKPKMDSNAKSIWHQCYHYVSLRL